MAVEIPVVVDIEQAFKDAAARVDQAMQPLKREIDGDVLNVKFRMSVPLGELEKFKGAFKEIERDVEGGTALIERSFEQMWASGKPNLKELGNAAASFKKQLNELWNSGKTGDKATLEALQQAIILCEEYVNQRNRAVELTREQYRESLMAARAEEQRNFIISQEAKTMAEMSRRISALRGRLENVTAGGKEWRDTAKEITKATAALGKFEQKYTTLITKPGSINRIAAEMKILEDRWNSMSRAQKFDKEGNLKASAQKVIDKFRQLTAESEKFGQSLSQAAGKVTTGMSQTIPALEKADSRLAMLVKRSIQLFALHAAGTFIRNIRQVTAEFEMLRVALGGIIQDTERANALFKEIKAAAVKSPFEIKDLVTYTKQLSAYRVETENLFHVTMQLADVSAGLGVDMSRLILAYGQVRAASVLRGQELRQFTEAGIPLVKLLADKFSDLRGEMVSTGEVFELISKRAVPFEMIAEIFDDMTARGGVFYKMQEKQAETLLGQWNNLKDALSIMYDEMGNTSTVHNAMTGLINDARVIFQNWRLIATAVKVAAYAFGAMKVASLWLPNLNRELSLAKKASDAYARSTELAAYATETGSVAASRASVRLKTYAALMKKASLETRFFHRTWLQLKAVMSGGGWVGLAIGALTTLVSVLISAWVESRRLGKELAKIGTEGDISINRSIANFTRLANAAAQATDGSKEQNDAIAELKRTYGDIIPAQELQVEKLRDLQEHYESLTHAIREKISEQIREQKISTITDDYGKKVTKKQNRLKDILSSYGLDRDQISAVADELQNAVERGMITVESTLWERRDAYEKIINELTGLTVDFGNGFRDLAGKWHSVDDVNDKAGKSLDSLVDVYLRMDSAIKDVNNDMADSIGTYGKFGKMSKDMEKELSEITVDTSRFGGRGTFAYNKENIRQSIEVYWDYLQQAFEEVNRERGEKIDITKAFLENGKIDFTVIDEAVREAMEGGANTHLDAFVNSIQEKYEKLVPSDRIVNLVREKVGQFAQQFGVSMDVAQHYYKNADTSMEDYVKTLEDAEKAQASSLASMKLNNEEIKNGAEDLEAYSNAEIEAAENTHLLIKALIDFFQEFQKHSGKNGPAYHTPPFIEQMRESIKFMQDFKKGYDNLKKYLSGDDALWKQLEIMKNRGLSLGIDIEEQKRAAEDLSGWFEDTMDSVFDEAKKHGATGTIESFLREQIKATSNRGKALKDFQKLLQSLWDSKTDFDTSRMVDNVERALKKMEEEVKRSEAAQNLFRDILGQTGNQEFASALTIAVYGDVGSDFKDRIQRQLDEAFMKINAKGMSAELQDKIIDAFENQDFGVIRENLDRFEGETRKFLEKLLNDVDKYNAGLQKKFADLASKSGTTAEKAAAIQAKADQEIHEAEEAAAQAIKRVREEALRQVQAAGDNQEAAAKAHAEGEKAVAIIQEQLRRIVLSLKSSAEYEIFKNSEDYVKFFAELNVMTAEQAALLRSDLREGFIKAFREGKIDANELYKSLRQIEAQYRRLSKHTTTFTTYIDKGITGVIDRYDDLGSMLDVIGQKIAKNEEELDESENLFLETMFEKFGSKFGGSKLAGISNFSDLVGKFGSNKEGMEAAGNAVSAMGRGITQMAGKGSAALAIVDAIFKAINGAITSIQEFVDEINRMRSEEHRVADGMKYISDINKYIYEGWEKVKAGDIIGSLMNLASAAASVFSNIQEDRVKKYNDAIKEQERLVDSLSHAYSRLQKAEEQALGSDMVTNYNQQLEALRAQEAAYREMARQERAKGKSAEEDVAKDYEKRAIEVADSIADLQGELARKLTGTDVASASRDFAQAWLDAYKSFSSTKDAITSEFQDMIEKMVTESLAAKVVEKQIKPIFDLIDKLTAEHGALSIVDASIIAQRAKETSDILDQDLSNLMNALSAVGLNVRSMGSGLTGIAKDIQGASEESILGLAAGVNTQNFYLQHINSNVDVLVNAVLSGTQTGPSAGIGAIPETDPIREHISTMNSNVAQIAERVASLESTLKKVVYPRGTNSTTHYVAVQ